MIFAKLQKLALAGHVFLGKTLQMLVQTSGQSLMFFLCKNSKMIDATGVGVTRLEKAASTITLRRLTSSLAVATLSICLFH